MHINFKRMVILVIVIALVGLPLGSALGQANKSKQEEIGAGSMFFDLVIVRPFSFAATVLGSAAFIVSLPFCVIGGNSEAAYEKMVIEPAKFTFQRPLGKL